MKPTPKSYQELVYYYADILPLLSTARKIALEAGMEDNIIDLSEVSIMMLRKQ